jgi:hypothetical protein
MVSPDLAADAPAPSSYADGQVSVTVGELDAYLAIVVQ